MRNICASLFAAALLGLACGPHASEGAQLLSMLNGLPLPSFSPQAAIDKVSGLCTKAKKFPLFKAMPCDLLANFGAILNMDPNLSTCNPDPLNGGELLVNADLGLKECAAKVTVGCAKGAGVVPQVLGLVTCVLKNVGPVVSRAGTIVEAAGKTVKDKPELSLLLHAVVALAFTLIDKILQLLCLQAPILLTVLSNLPAGVLIILVLASFGALSIPLAGPLLFVVLIVVTLIAFALVTIVALILLGLVSVLEVLLVPVITIVVILLATGFGLHRSCLPQCNKDAPGLKNMFNCAMAPILAKIAKQAERGGPLGDLAGTLTQTLLKLVLGLLGAPLGNILESLGSGLEKVDGSTTVTNTTTITTTG